MTLDRHNSLIDKGFSAAYLGLMALMVVVCSVKLPPHVKTLVEIGLGAVALVGMVMIAVAHFARIEDVPSGDGA
jgi:hypothetical protein